jgi:hypothetical protein
MKTKKQIEEDQLENMHQGVLKQSWIHTRLS